MPQSGEEGGGGGGCFMISLILIVLMIFNYDCLLCPDGHSPRLPAAPHSPSGSIFSGISESVKTENLQRLGKQTFSKPPKTAYDGLYLDM